MAEFGAMFTGLIEDLARVRARYADPDGCRLEIETPLAAELNPGDSIAVNGACLTATEVPTLDAPGRGAVGAGAAGCFAADVMNQTLELTALGNLQPGDMVNVERAALLGDRLGGHLVQGHVDCVGRVLEARPDGLARRLRVEVPDAAAPYLIEQGSIAIDGASLTIATLGPGWLEVSLIPETVARTTLGTAEPGRTVNLEFDLIARYVERMVEPWRPHTGEPPAAPIGEDGQAR